MRRRIFFHLFGEYKFIEKNYIKHKRGKWGGSENKHSFLFVFYITKKNLQKFQFLRFQNLFILDNKKKTKDIILMVDILNFFFLYGDIGPKKSKIEENKLLVNIVKIPSFLCLAVHFTTVKFPNLNYNYLFKMSDI